MRAVRPLAGGFAALNWAAEWCEPQRGPIDQVIRTALSMVLHALRPEPSRSQ